MVLKHSSRTPLCANAFQAAFEAAGCPEGLLTALHCSHSVIDDVIGDQRVQFVAFTGSVEGGHSIYQSIARSRFIDCTLELGGKDPAYVAEDANMEAAVGTLVDGAFYNAGQVQLGHSVCVCLPLFGCRLAHLHLRFGRLTHPPPHFP